MSPALRAIAVILLGAAALADAARASNGAGPIAVGGRAAGRGGADTAIADDTLSLHYQPAGLAQIGRLRFDIQDMGLVSRNRFVNSLNDEQDTNTNFLIPSLGVAVDPFWGEPASVPIRIGFGAAGVFGGGGSKTVITTIFPEGVKEYDDFAVIRLGPVLAVEPIPGLRVGFGAFYNYVTFKTQSATTNAGGNANGRVRVFRNPDGSTNDPPQDFLVDGEPVTWQEVFTIGSSPDSNSAAFYELLEASNHGISFNVGIQFDVTDWLTLGASYVSPTMFFGSIEGTARVDATKALQAIQSDPDIQAILGPVLDAYLPGGQNANFLAEYDYEIDDFNVPQIVSVGAAFYPHEMISFALDVRWMQWSQPFHRITANLTNGTNANINEINGTDSVTSSSNLDWKDIIVVGVGTTIAPADWLALRLGYNYSSNPLQDDLVGPGSTTFLMHHITTGATVEFVPGFSATAAIVYAIPREVETNPHRNTPEYSGASYSADQTFFYLGFALEM